MKGALTCEFCHGTGLSDTRNSCLICIGRGFMVRPEAAPDRFYEAQKSAERSANWQARLTFALLAAGLAALLVLCAGCEFGDYLNKKFGRPERSIPERRR